MNDFWNGHGASFPKAVQWITWFNYWKHRYDSGQPIERFIVDASMKLQQTYVKMSQNIRKNLTWTRSFTGDEMHDILALAEEADAWFFKHCPREDQLRVLDPRLVFIVEALKGAFGVATRLARELDQINRKGFVMVDTSIEATELKKSA